jgi:hypothetical protein
MGYNYPMHWQDMVISVGQWIMIAALLPTMFGKDKPALSSSLMTATLIAAFGVAYGTLALWSSAASSTALTIAWLVLAYQQWRILRARRGDKI